MKSNFNELFKDRLSELRASEDIDIDDELDFFMENIRFKGNPSKMQFMREVVRGIFTSALNAEQIYSHKKGHFVYIGNANEEQLKHFMEKAEKDRSAAERRKAKAEELIGQIKLAWDENGKFIGFIIPETKVNV